MKTKAYTSQENGFSKTLPSSDSILMCSYVKAGFGLDYCVMSPGRLHGVENYGACLGVVSDC